MLLEQLSRLPQPSASSCLIRDLQVYMMILKVTGVGVVGGEAGFTA